ncbi:hypothetical protein BDV26DRAFT_272880 [Aspergillus bertholletiae]|uniref:Uncharacterized protein n=1 Tax=Aspergillus bertholletiae TaxID=1226010 RepID=A0A5N7AW96_9EURO|nr:hypothetical protein BDV26DRAFT_272880 [Aspergillus bertholletiae]
MQRDVSIVFTFREDVERRSMKLGSGHIRSIRTRTSLSQDRMPRKDWTIIRTFFFT